MLFSNLKKNKKKSKLIIIMCHVKRSKNDMLLNCLHSWCINKHDSLFMLLFRAILSDISSRISLTYSLFSFCHKVSNDCFWDYPLSCRVSFFIYLSVLKCQIQPYRARGFASYNGIWFLQFPLSTSFIGGLFLCFFSSLAWFFWCVIYCLAVVV